MMFVQSRKYVDAVLISMAILALGDLPLLAGGEGGGTESPFSLGAGGRSIAMGGAKCVVWGEAYTLLWNPAGLEYLERGEINLFHTPLLDETSSYSSILGSYPLTDFGAISFGVLRLDVGGIERRDQENLVIDGELSNRQTRYLFGYARKIYRGLSGGVTMKLDRFVQGSYNASGFGVDAGFGVKSDIDNEAFDGAALGLTLINIIEPKLKLEDEESGDPYGTRVGFAVWRSLSGRFDDRLLVAVDMIKTKHDEARIQAGFEYSVNRMLALRGGWDSGSPTFGLGFSLSFLQLDYAWRDSDLENCHLFSLSYRFGSSKTERIERRKKEREEEIKRELERETARYETRQMENYLAKAREALRQDKFSQAEDHFKTVLLWDPENEEAKAGNLKAQGYIIITLADSLFADGSYGEALMHYRKGNEKLSISAIDDRIRECEKLIGQTADQRQMIDAVFAHAVELYSERDWTGAVAAFAQVLRLDPGHDIARHYYDKATARHKEDYARVLQQTGVLARKKRYGEAIDLLRSGLDKFKGDAELEKKLAEVMELRQREEISTMEKEKPAATKAPLTKEEADNLRLIYEKGAEYFKNGKFDRAIVEWEKVWHGYPGSEQIGEYLVKAYLYRGMELYTMHDYEEALEIWGRILKVDPDNEKAIRYIRRTKEELSSLENVAG
ncbi:MAG: PorV/PorQ family protein [Candidatus Krumholzibacteriota bacterium]|nr:PorV/PorQ family protein [Candidatus Krumholzibacteriota bacterium]